MKTFAAAAKIASDGNKLGVIFTRPSRPEWIQGVAYTESEARQPIPSYFAMVYPATRLSSQALEAASDLPSRDECLVELTTLLAGEITEDAVDVQSRDRHLERSDSTNAMFELEGNRFFGSSLGSDDRPTTTF
ncbi:MAG: hypothetical protein QE278_04705 [Limnobacter sp.]|nr:hypothetical protein [Limnobacter sp.]